MIQTASILVVEILPSENTWRNTGSSYLLWNYWTMYKMFKINKYQREILELYQFVHLCAISTRITPAWIKSVLNIFFSILGTSLEIRSILIWKWYLIYRSRKIESNFKSERKERRNNTKRFSQLANISFLH